MGWPQCTHKKSEVKNRTFTNNGHQRLNGKNTAADIGRDVKHTYTSARGKSRDGRDEYKKRERERREERQSVAFTLLVFWVASSPIARLEL